MRAALSRSDRRCVAASTASRPNVDECFRRACPGLPCSGERSGLGCRRRAASGALASQQRARDAQRPRSTRGSSLGDWCRVRVPRAAALGPRLSVSLECCIAARPPAAQAIAKECVVNVILKAQQRTESRAARLASQKAAIANLPSRRAFANATKTNRPHPSATGFLGLAGSAPSRQKIKKIK